MIVARSDHRLARTPAPVSARVLAEEEWLVDPSGTDPLSEVGRLLASLHVQEERINVFPTALAAWSAAAAGIGIAPAVEHLFAHHDQPALSVLPVAGMPTDLMWYVNVLSADRRAAITSRLLRFIGTPDATHAMFRADGRVPASRFKPPVYVTIWN
jgi:DNA-binding transcriptional LysR family regulator